PLPALAAEFGISRPTLREALRILEMEFLLTLRSGDRDGAQIRHPSTRAAARLAGVVLEARHATMRDYHRASQLIEPAIVEISAVRVDRRTIAGLNGYLDQLADAADDT